MADNRILQNINLSWNNLCDSKQSEKEQSEVATWLGAIIKYNPALYHLDLTSTGLTHLVVFQLGTAIRRAKLLLSIHLSDNPGLV